MAIENYMYLYVTFTIIQYIGTKYTSCGHVFIYHINNIEVMCLFSENHMVANVLIIKYMKMHRLIYYYYNFFL